MPVTLAQKLKIKEGFILRTLNAPSDFEDTLQPLPEGVKITTKGNNFQQVHWFVKDKAQMEEELNEVLPLIKGDITCWIYYPKGTSKIQTDLTRDKGWDALLQHKEMQWLSLISFDATWSAFAFRPKSEKDKPKEAQPKDREIVKYVDAAKKIVYLPEDLEKALQENPKEKEYFESLAFSHKREYVEWIVSAKKEETRLSRINGTIERLDKGWKNPVNR